VIECEPTASVEVVKVVLPLLSVPVPSVVVPSLNVTVPVAAVGDSVAVNVTDVPYPDGFTDEASVVVVLVFASAGTAQKHSRDKTTRMIDATALLDAIAAPSTLAASE
jgi:hypothetical protein